MTPVSTSYLDTLRGPAVNPDERSGHPIQSEADDMLHPFRYQGFHTTATIQAETLPKKHNAHIYSLHFEKNRYHLAKDIFKWIFLYKTLEFQIKFKLK